MSKLRRKAATLLVALAATTIIPAGVVAQERGAVAGQVIAQPGGAPLSGANIVVQGTALRTITDAQGRFRIGDLPPGRYAVIASFIGRETATRSITVAAGQTATISFALGATATELEGIVVSATGREERRRELGNVVSTVNVAEDVELATVNNFSQLLQARAPGVTVLQSSGTTGGGSRIRIRGSNSVSLSNSPLIVIDGVRINDTPQSFGLFTGGQTVSRLDDINPEDIESIEVLKGPAAAALYGTAAANGVIQVITKKGRPGTPRIQAYVEGSTAELDYDWPDNYYARPGTALTSTSCSIIARNAGTCTTPNQLFVGTPLDDPALTPFRDGSGSRYGVSVSGGSDVATYFVSADREQETGVQMENELESVNLRANLTGHLRDNLRIGVNTSYLDKLIQLPQNDNSALSPFSNTLQGSPNPLFTDSTLQGGRFYTGGYRYPYTREIGLGWDQFQDVQRFTGSANANWSPVTWLQFNGTAGLDLLNRFDNGIVAPGPLRLFGSPFAEGLREQWRVQIYNYTANGSATAIYPLVQDLVSTSGVGVQYVQDQSNNTFASGSGISPGTRTTTVPRSVTEGFADNKTFGAFVQQQLAWRDRVFINGALRGDQNSAFGQNLDFVWYPSLSGSWVVSDEDFFPQTAGALSNLRLRAAWGKSGLRPGLSDALQFFTTASASVRNQIVPGFIIAGAGNLELKPEVATEFETGVDIGLFDERLGLQFTYYAKKSEDALINRPLPASFGSVASRTENLGSVRNSGIEVLANAEVFRSDRFALDFSASYSTNENELLQLGEDIPPIVFGVQRHREGYPLGGYWLRPYTFNDADGDERIGASEVTVEDSVQYMGTPFPTRELQLSGNVRLFNVITLSGLLDHRGGHKQFNWTEFSRCVAGLVCRAAQDPDAPLADQAALIAAFEEGDLGATGYLEDADFWKLREVSLAFSVPRAFTQRFGLRDDGLRLTFAGRNLKTWTDYSGFDPEVNSTGQSNFTTDDYYTLPPARQFTIRLDVGL